MSSHRASRFNLQNECYFPDKTVFSVFFSQRWFTVKPPVGGAKVGDGSQPDATSHSALIRKKGTLIFGAFLPE